MKQLINNNHYHNLHSHTSKIKDTHKRQVIKIQYLEIHAQFSQHRVYSRLNIKRDIKLNSNRIMRKFSFNNTVRITGGSRINRRERGR